MKLLALVLLANSALAQLSLDDSSPDEGFDVMMSEGQTQVFTVVVSGSATPTYTWYLNGNDQNVDGASFEFAPDFSFVQNRSSGDLLNIWCDISAGGSQVTASWIVELQDTNRLPSVGDIQLQESPQGRVSRFATLNVVRLAGTASDPDPEDTLQYLFRWSNGETTVEDGPNSEPSSSLDLGPVANDGDVWKVTMWAVDDQLAESLDFVESPEFTVNNRPVMDGAEIAFEHPFTLPDPFNSYNAEIRALPGGMTDADPDDNANLTYRYQWIVDGGEVSLGPFDDLRLDEDFFVLPGSSVRVDIYPQDIYEEGIPASSRTIKIGSLLQLDYSGGDGGFLVNESLQFGFFEEASAGEDQYDAVGGSYFAVLDSLDLDTANYYYRSVVPPAAEHRFPIVMYSAGFDFTLSWQPPGFFDFQIWLMEVNESGRVISDQIWDLTQAGTMQIEDNGERRYFLAWVRPFDGTPLLRPVRRGWNLMAPNSDLLDSNLVGTVGPGVPSGGLVWDAQAAQFQAVDSFQGLLGCWVFVDIPNPIMTLVGNALPASSVDLVPGWNLVGVSRPMQAPSGGVFRGPVWGWNGSYRTVDQLLPGQAYWINVSAPASLPVE